jgi:hypothetical protein
VIKLQATKWKSWERYVPAEMKAGNASVVRDCLKPWEQLFPMEGIEEAMSGTTDPWRTWEKYAPQSASDIASMQLLIKVSKSLEEIQA